MLEILNAYAIPSLLILLLALLRACLGRRIPRKFFYILWTAAALRLIIPLTVGLPLLPYEAVSEKTAFTSALAADGTLREPTVYESSGPFGTNLFNQSIFTLIYIFGAAAIALHFCIGHIRTVNRCKISLPFQTETDELKAALSLRRYVDIRTCENAVSPFTYGIFHPVIILPEGVSGDRLRHILGHELVHIKRMDVLRKLLFALALCIHWINPAVWLLYALAQRDMEITCDEEAVERLSFSPKSYALTLIDMEEQLLSSVLTAFGKKPVRERIERLAQLGRTPSVMGAAAGFAAVTVAAAFFTALEHMPPRVVYITADTADISYAARETAAVSVTTVTVTDGMSFYETEASDLSEQAVSDDAWELDAAANNAFEATVTSVWYGIFDILNSDSAASVAAEAAEETVCYSDEYVIAVRADNIAEDSGIYSVEYTDTFAGEAASEFAGDFAGDFAGVFVIAEDTVAEYSE